MLTNNIVSYRNGVLEVPRGEMTIGLGFNTMVSAVASDLKSLAVKCACVVETVHQFLSFVVR